MTWTSLTLEVTTPLFNGGAGVGEGTKDYPEDKTGVRVPSLRGAMRFWFRALAGLGTGPNLALLADLERDVFGGINPGPSRDDQSDSIAAPVQLRIPVQPPVSSTRRPRFLKRPEGDGIAYLLGQGLTEWDKRDKAVKLTRPYVAPGERFELKLRASPDKPHAFALTLAALWLMCTYGGLGARVRRGFGGLRIVDADGPLPEPWNADTIRTPSLEHYERLRHLRPDGEVGSRVLRHLKPLFKERCATLNTSSWEGRRPTFPVLSKTHTRVQVSVGEGFPSWEEAAAFAGRQLRRFRADVDSGNRRRSGMTREWTQVINGPEDHFPLGALGLPVGFQRDIVVNVEDSRDPRRRASPLWLRPVGDGDTWRLLSFAFLGELLPGPEELELVLRKPGSRRILTMDDDDLDEQAARWMEGIRAGNDFGPGVRTMGV